VDLRSRGITEKQAADLRGRLSTFAEDGDHPEMDVYDESQESEHRPRGHRAYEPASALLERIRAR
jgi:hypothetical protein